MNSLKRFGLLCATLASLNYGCSAPEKNLEINESTITNKTENKTENKTTNAIKESEKSFELSSAKLFGRDKNSIIKPIISLSLDLQAGMPINRIKRVPERMKFVKDDYGDTQLGGNSVSPGTLTDFRFGKVGLETKLHERFFFDIYGAGSVHCSYLFTGFGSHEHDSGGEFSKQGHEQAYWGAGFEPFFIPEVRGDFHVKLSKDGDSWLVLGGGYREYGLEILNGIHTAGSPDSVDKRFKIGEIRETSVYAALEGMTIDEKFRYGIRLGAGFVDYEKRNKEVDVDVNKIFPFGGFYLELRF